MLTQDDNSFETGRELFDIYDYMALGIFDIIENIKTSSKESIQMNMDYQSTFKRAQELL